MSTYLFIHGAWHGSWCWHKVVARLEKAGHAALAPDLPGLGRDQTPAAGITLATWTDYVCRLLDAQPEPVILVGHSRGGIVISQAAEQRPGRIAALVYVTAFLLRDGESLQSKVQEDPNSRVPLDMVLADDHSSATIKDEVVREVFYGRCSDDDVVLARSLLRPEPTAPLATPLRLSEGGFGRVPRYYVECRRDRAIPVALQQRMYTALPCRRVFSIDTDHSPFFSTPDELVARLLDVCNS